MPQRASKLAFGGGLHGQQASLLTVQQLLQLIVAKQALLVFIKISWSIARYAVFITLF
jgi:hypothetical protein